MTTLPLSSAPSVASSLSPRTLKEYFRRPGALTQRALADRVGAHQSMISLVANRQRACRGQLAHRIHKETGVPLEALVLLRRSPRKRRPPGRHDEPFSLPLAFAEEADRRRGADDEAHAPTGDDDDDADDDAGPPEPLAH